MQRDTKIYAIGGTTISPTGISVNFLKVVGPFTILGFVIGLVICFFTGKHYYNPLHSDFSMWFIALTVGLFGGIGYSMWAIKIQSYRLFEYLYAYLKPKYIYNNQSPKAARQKYTNVKVDGLMRGWL